MSSNTACPSGFSGGCPMKPAYQSEDAKPLKFFGFALAVLQKLIAKFQLLIGTHIHYLIIFHFDR